MMTIPNQRKNTKNDMQMMNNEITSKDIEELCKKTVELKPAFTERNVAVAVFSSLELLPMAAIVFQSIIENANSQRNYDLILVCSDTPEEEDQVRLFSMVRGMANFSLRVVDGSAFTKLLHTGLKQEDFRWNIDGECLRLFIPLVCRNYEKVVCLGADVAVVTDIAELYDIELDGHVVASAPLSKRVLSFWFKYFNMKLDKIYPKPWEYEDVNSWSMPDHVYVAKLGVAYGEPGINGDVMLLDIPVLIREEFVKNGTNSLLKDRWRTLTEAVYNKFLLPKGCLYLPPEWNVRFLWRDILETMDETTRREYFNILQKAKIFHYVGSNNKPWRNPAAARAEVWWRYARRTPFYEKLLCMVMQVEANKEADKVKNWLCPTTVLKNTMIDRTLNINVRVGLSPVDNSFAHKNNNKKHPMFARTKV